MDRDLSRRLRQDDGVALVVALAVTAIAFVVVSAVLAQAIHNVVQSGYGRRRFVAVNAAEGGLNWYANELTNTSLAALATAGLGWALPVSTCQSEPLLKDSCWYVYSGVGGTTGATATVPERASYQVRVLYTSQNPCRDPSTGQNAQCGLANVPARPSTVGQAVASPQTGVLLLNDTPTAPFPDPAYAIVRVVGSVGSTQRALEAYVRMDSERGGVRGGISAISICLASGADVYVEGDLAVNNEAVLGGSRPAAFNEPVNCPDTFQYGDLVVESGGSLEVRASALIPTAIGSLSVRGGGVWVQGNAKFWVNGDLWSEGAIRIGCATVGTCTGGEAFFLSHSQCTESGTIQCVKDDALGATIDLGPYAQVEGNAIQCTEPCPPPSDFASLTWNEADWTTDGWSVQYPISSTSVISTLTTPASMPTVKTVYRLGPSASPCDIDLSGAQILLKAPVAVVSECRFIFDGAGASIEQATGTSGGALLFISAAPAAGVNAAACGTSSSSSPGPKDFVIANNPHFASPVFFYTPCILWFRGNQSKGSFDTIEGQFIGRYMIIKNGVKLIQRDMKLEVGVSVPGQIASFQIDTRFIREISPTKVLANLA